MSKVITFEGREGHKYIVDMEYNQEFESLQLQAAQVERLVCFSPRQQLEFLEARNGEGRNLIRRMIRKLGKLDRMLRTHRD